MKKRLCCLCSMLIGVTIACHAQRIETSRQTIKGDFDNDRREDRLAMVCKTHYEKGEEDSETWYFSRITIDGKIVLGNERTLHFTDTEPLDAVMGGTLNYFSPRSGVLLRVLRVSRGSTVALTYDYYLYDAALQDWYRYKTATYDQATWKEVSVGFEYYDKARKPLVGTELQSLPVSHKDPMLPKNPLKYLIRETEKKHYPKSYYDFVSCIEVLNHIDKRRYRKEIKNFAKRLKSHDARWGNYIVSTYLK